MAWDDDLNGDQLDAASHIGNHACLLSGPGTGKTLCLTRRILYLIEEEDKYTFKRGFHASGHLSLAEIEWVISEISPKCIIPVHTEHTSWFEKFPHTRILRNGETLTL